MRIASPASRTHEIAFRDPRRTTRKPNHTEQKIMNNDFESIGALLDNEGIDAAQRNVAVAEFDLGRELSDLGTFVMLGFEQLDLALHSDSVKFLNQFPERTKFMAPGVMAQLADSLSSSAEIAQAELGFKDPLNHFSITQIEECIQILAFAMHGMYEAASATLPTNEKAKDSFESHA